MGTQPRGYQSNLVLSFESAYKTLPETPVGYQMPFNTNALKSARAKSKSETMLNSRNPREPFDGFTTASGNIVVPLDAEAFPLWLMAMFGEPVTTGASAPYTHVFKLPETVPSFSVGRKLALDTALYPRVSGVKINTMSFTAGGSAEALVTLACEGADETMDATPIDATPVVPLYDKFSQFQASLKIGGTTVADVPSVSINIGNDLDTSEDYYCIGGNGVRGDLPEGIPVVNGSIKTLFKSQTYLDMALANTETSLELKYTKGAKSLTFLFNELQFARSTPGIEGPKGIMLELPFEAYLGDHVGASAVIVTAINTTAAYSLGD